MVFQAMAGRYRLRDTLSQLFSGGSMTDSLALKAQLATRYGVLPQDVVLYHKGRAALAAGLQLVASSGDKVAISGLTCYSVVQAVEAAGITPIYVDIRESDLQFGPEELQATLARHPGIKAVVIQNMLGIPADITGIEAVARTHSLTIVEDLAHSAGAHYADGREVGTVGAVTMLSLGKDKALDVVNGGALVIRNGALSPTPTALPSLGEQLRDRLYPLIAGLARLVYPLALGNLVMGVAIRLRLVVRSADGVVDTSVTMPHWQARRAIRQLAELAATVEQRQACATRYMAELAPLMPAAAALVGASLIRVPLLVDSPRDIIAALEKQRIHASDIWYDVPVSPVRYYKKLVYPAADCPVAVKVAARLVNLPTHQRVKVADIERATRAVREVTDA